MDSRRLERKLSAILSAVQTPVSSHLFMEASSHLIAAAPNWLILEHMQWWQELFAESLPVVDGQVLVPDKPGIGLALNRKAVERFSV